MKYFIDTNIIIDLLNNDNRAKEKLKKIIQEKDSEVYINSLVGVESLRTIHYKNTKIFRDSKATLDTFSKAEIKQEIYDEAIRFSRYCNSKGIVLKGKCEAIDFIHFLTAKYYSLTILSNDKDMEKLEPTYIEFIQQRN